MEKKLYKIKPILQETVWGGRKIIDYYHLQTDFSNVAEMYHVIALKDHFDNEVEGTGKTLSEFYEAYPELFDCRCPVFPVRMATSCAEKKQSYHLHPDNAYAWEHEHCLGKATGSIPYEPKGETRHRFFGHTAKTLEEFKEKVEHNDWDSLRKFVDIRDDQYFHTIPGLIHGGGGSTNPQLGIAFAQNSDITYRAYDFGRNDPNRKLHLKQVYDCINVPDIECKPIDVVPRKEKGCIISDYYDCPEEYTAKRIDIEDEGRFERDEFYFLLNAKGEGSIDNEEIRMGETVFVPAHYGEIVLRGKMKLYLISYRENV